MSVEFTIYIFDECSTVGANGSGKSNFFHGMLILNIWDLVVLFFRDLFNGKSTYPCSHTLCDKWSIP